MLIDEKPELDAAKDREERRRRMRGRALGLGAGAAWLVYTWSQPDMDGATRIGLLLMFWIATALAIGIWDQRDLRKPSRKT